MKSHMEMCGKDFTGSEGTQERSLEVCKHWRRGRCDWGSSCNFSHVGCQDTSRPERQSTGSASIICRNGPTCSFLARGRCNFQHHMNSGHKENNTANQNRRHSSQGWRQEAPRSQCSASGGGTVTESPTALIFTALRIFPNTATTRGSEEPGRETTQDSQGSKSFK